MMTRGGSERNRSTRKMISQLIGRTPRLRSRASARPARRPLSTISTASSMVTTTPDRMSGRYFAITLPLKKVSTKRSQVLMERGPPGPHHGHERTWRSALRRTSSMPLDLADEGAGAFLGRRLEDRGRRTLLDDQAVIHEEHAVGGVPGKAHLVADHDHGHARFAQRPHDLQHRAHQLRIERAGRFVEQHDARLERDGARDGDALLLAAGELARRVAGAVGEADAPERRHPERL